MEIAVIEFRTKLGVRRCDLTSAVMTSLRMELMFGLKFLLIGCRGLMSAAAVVGLVIETTAWTVQGWRKDSVIAQPVANFTEQREVQAQTTVAAVETAREEGRRRTVAVEKARDNATNQAAAAAADAALARIERDGLRIRANSLALAAIS